MLERLQRWYSRDVEVVLPHSVCVPRTIAKGKALLEVEDFCSSEPR